MKNKGKHFETATNLMADLLLNVSEKFLRWFIAAYPTTHPVKPQITGTRTDNEIREVDVRERIYGDVQKKNEYKMWRIFEYLFHVLKTQKKQKIRKQKKISAPILRSRRSSLD